MDNNSIYWSAIIPTLNRATSLQRTLQSLVSQGFAHNNYEILIIDNGSTDNTKDVIQAFIKSYPKHNIKYFYDPIPGLLTGRHRGLAEASADVLTFFDDDVTVNENFVTQVIKVFTDKNVVIAGGPSFPEYEVEPPTWMEYYWDTTADGIRACPALSLMDAGKSAHYIDPIYIWGLNFSIRKSTLIEVGGFAPDGYPSKYHLLRTAGECAVTRKLGAQGTMAYYDPKLQVIHHIPASRVVEKYFIARMYNSGIESSASHLQLGEIGKHIPFPRRVQDGNEGIHDRIYNGYVEGYLHHHLAALKNKSLMEWVLRPCYMNIGELPMLPENLPICMEHILDGKFDLLDDSVLVGLINTATLYKKTQNVWWRRGLRFLRKIYHLTGVGRLLKK